MKPSNVLLDEHGGIRVADFGLCKIEASDLTMLTSTGRGGGTIKYAAPEQLRDMKAADARADVYSMGMILLDCLAGNTLAGVSDRPTKLRREAGLHFDALVARATAFRPEDRFQTIVELRDALSTLPDRNPQAFRNS